MIQTILDANGTMSDINVTHYDFCHKENRCNRLVLQTNMSNPQEHCNKGFHNWCVPEGGVHKYWLQLGQRPRAPVRVAVHGKHLQYEPETVFTPDTFNVDHEIILVFKENIEVSGNYWMNLHHTVTMFNISGSTPVGWTFFGQDSSAVVDDIRNFTTRSPRIQNVTGWSELKLVCPESGHAYSTTIPVLVTDNDAAVVYKLVLGVDYSSLHDMKAFTTLLKGTIGTAINVVPERIRIVHIRPAGMKRRRQQASSTDLTRIGPYHRNLAENNYVSVTFYFFDAVLGAAKPDDLYNALKLLVDTGKANVHFKTIPVMSLSKDAAGVLGVSMATIVSASQPAERGPFQLDSSFFSNSSGFFTDGRPDAALEIAGLGNGTYIFRPCIHMPTGIRPGTVQCGATRAEMCLSGSCNATCVWNQVVRYENNLPTILIPFDDPCFTQYPPQKWEQTLENDETEPQTSGGGVDLYAWVQTKSEAQTVVTITMERGIKWRWMEEHVELQSPPQGMATGYEPRSMVDTGTYVTSLDVRSYVGISNKHGLSVFNSSLQYGDIQIPEIYQVPSPPPLPWGSGLLVDDRTYVKSPRIPPSTTMSCSSARKSEDCKHGGFCSDWKWLDRSKTQ
eukprot:COSAG05_NODE_1816_length_4031_cov_2.062309_2_plen_618_part_00